MQNPIVTSETKDHDTGLRQFSFLYNGKEYTVTPIPLKEWEPRSLSSTRYDKLQKFFKFVDYVCPKKGKDPFSFSEWRKYLDIDRIGAKKQKPEKKPKQEPKQEAEQLSLKLAIQAIEKIANSLEEKGAFEESYLMDIIANTIESNWDSINVISFSDEIANNDIPPEKAYLVIQAFNKGADTEHSVAEVTGVDAWTCKIILDIAHKHNLIK